MVGHYYVFVENNIGIMARNFQTIWPIIGVIVVGKRGTHVWAKNILPKTRPYVLNICLSVGAHVGIIVRTYIGTHVGAKYFSPKTRPYVLNIFLSVGVYVGIIVGHTLERT